MKEIIDFAEWYSGMERSKVVSAYNRYLIEKKSIISAQVETPSVSDNETKKKKLNPEYCNFFNTCEDDICNAGAICANDTRI